MAISNYGELKGELSAYLFHQRFLARYDTFTTLFEDSANARLRVLPMETLTNLTTVSGDVALPTDYVTWRTVLYTGYNPTVELEYVHPAYLGSTAASIDGNPQLFTIEGNTFKVRPANDTADAYEFHYYRKIPTLLGNDLNTNWLLTNFPNVYLFGLMTEAMALGRNVEEAQLYKARRDEIFQEIIQRYAMTTGATSPRVRTAEYF